MKYKERLKECFPFMDLSPAQEKLITTIAELAYSEGKMDGGKEMGNSVNKIMGWDKDER